MVTGKSGENQERTKKKMMKEEERDEDEKKYKRITHIERGQRGETAQHTRDSSPCRRMRPLSKSRERELNSIP
jgi:hypothetical protein